MKKEMNKFVLISEKGIMGSKGMETVEVMAMIVDAFLQIWNEEVFEIDMEKGVKSIIEAMEKSMTGEDPEDEEDDEEDEDDDDDDDMEEKIEEVVGFLSGILGKGSRKDVLKMLGISEDDVDGEA